MSNRDFHVWDGVYASFAEAHGDLAVFNAAKWLERSKEKALALRERFTKEHRTQLSTQDYCLPLLAAVCGASLHRLRILDFGGALGFSFFPVRAGLPAEIALNFEIVEQPAGHAVAAPASAHRRLPQAGRHGHPRRGLRRWPGSVSGSPISDTQ